MAQIDQVEVRNPGNKFREDVVQKLHEEIAKLITGKKLSPLEATYLVANLALSVGKASLEEGETISHEDWLKQPSLPKATIIAGNFILETHKAIVHAIENGTWPESNFFNLYGGMPNG